MLAIVLTLALPALAFAQEAFFPYELPKQKPWLPMSAAMERAYDDYEAPTYWDNELFSEFQYTELEGLDYHGGDGTISRRDSTKVIKANGKYYVWYTRRATDTPTCKWPSRLMIGTPSPKKEVASTRAPGNSEQRNRAGSGHGS